MIKKKTPVLKWILMITILLILAGTVTVLWTKTNAVHKLFRSDSDYQLTATWDERNFEELYTFSKEILDDEPLNKQALTYLGLSSFYLSLKQPDREDQIIYLDESIYAFRILLQQANDQERTIIQYYLGKCYMLKGPYYADMAVYYLERTLEDELNQTDTYEFLGEAYLNLQEFDKSLYFLKKSFDDHPSARTAMMIGEVSSAKGDYEESVVWFTSALDLIKDQTLLKEGLFKLAKLYYDNNDFDKSEETLVRYIDIEENDPEAYFLLGEIYFYRGDITTARRYWFKTTRLDPGHKPALYRLYD